MTASQAPDQVLALPTDLGCAVDATLEAWRREDWVRRLWAHDASLWPGGDAAEWLGWLDIASRARTHTADLAGFAAEVAHEGVRHILLLGMGGSSLGPEVIGETFGQQPGRPALLVLDSTDPAQIRSFEHRIDPARTLFVVSSKSGTTLEPNILMQYFFARAEAALGVGRAGGHFVAVTDPGSALETAARRHGFRRVFHGDPKIGGRYSVLSAFGLVPAAAMGLDVDHLLETADAMVRRCGASVPPADNPAVRLGATLGLAARAGRDKATIVASPSLADFGAWLEQLLAESTGKDGRGIVPVDNERLASPSVYGADRVFVRVALAGEDDAGQIRALAALEAAGHPVLRITVADRYHLGQEFFRWELATAAAGAVIGIDPFDQPDVEASKVKTRALTEAYEKSGALPRETPLVVERGLTLFADAGYATALAAASGATTLDGWLRAHLGRAGAGDYCAFLAYIERNPRHIAALQEMRLRVRDARRVATCVGFGPRFLHSTGQAYKGGPASGVFLQLTADDAHDLAVPGKGFSFGVVKAAQAQGDFAVLAERNRRALRIHLGRDIEAGLATLADAIRRALG